MIDFPLPCILVATTSQVTWTWTQNAVKRKG